MPPCPALLPRKVDPLTCGHVPILSLHFRDVMNGAESLVHTLADSGIEICFGNPGTSEMHFVVALDREPRMRGVLCLVEGVAAGAARDRVRRGRAGLPDT